MAAALDRESAARGVSANTETKTWIIKVSLQMMCSEVREKKKKTSAGTDAFFFLNVENER